MVKNKERIFKIYFLFCEEINENIKRIRKINKKKRMGKVRIFMSLIITLGIISSFIAIMGSIIFVAGLIKNRSLIYYKLDNIYLFFFIILQQFIIFPEISLFLNNIFDIPLIMSNVWIWKMSILLGLYGISLYIYRLNSVLSSREVLSTIIMFVGGAAAGGVATSLLIEKNGDLSRLIYYEPFVGAIITVYSLFLLSLIGFLSIFTYYSRKRNSFQKRYKIIIFEELLASIFFMIGCITIMLQRTLILHRLPFNFFIFWWGISDGILGISLLKNKVAIRLPSDSVATLLSIRRLDTQSELIRINLRAFEEDPNLLSTVLFGAGIVFQNYSTDKLTTIFEGTKGHAIVSLYKNLVGIFHLYGKGSEKDEIALYLFLKAMYKRKPKSVNEIETLIDLYLSSFFDAKGYSKKDYEITLFSKDLSALI